MPEAGLYFDGLVTKELALSARRPATFRYVARQLGVDEGKKKKKKKKGFREDGGKLISAQEVSPILLLQAAGELAWFQNLTRMQESGWAATPPDQPRRS